MLQKPTPLKRLFKTQALSCLDEIYGTAVSLCQDLSLAEDLTVQTYETLCREYINDYKEGDVLRTKLYRGLIQSYLANPTLQFKLKQN